MKVLFWTKMLIFKGKILKKNSQKKKESVKNAYIAWSSF